MTRADSDDIVGKHRYTTVMARIGSAPTTVAAVPVCEPEAEAERTDVERTDIVVLLDPAPEHDDHDDHHHDHYDDAAEPLADEHPTEEVADRGLDGAPDPDADAQEPDEPGARTGAGSRRWLVAALAAATVVALVAAVAVIAGAGTSPARSDTTARPIPAAAADPAPPRTAVFGETVRLADGWTVRIDRPAALRDEEYAELPSGTDRAVRLLVTVRNDAEEARDSAGWSVKATADSRPVELLDGDGYAGAEAPSRTLLPGAALTLAVAVPMPVEPTDLQVEAARTGRPPAIFVGRA
jgi:hypothetical protein